MRAALAGELPEGLQSSPADPQVLEPGLARDGAVPGCAAPGCQGGERAAPAPALPPAAGTGVLGWCSPQELQAKGRL